MEILAEEMTLQELRKALDRSQEMTAEAPGLKQAAVSRLENRDNMQVSKLRDIHALGEEWEFYARFKERGDKARLVCIRNINTNEHHTD